MKKRQKISILIPAYNEEEVLRPLYERLTALTEKAADFDFEFLFVDDGSQDNTLSIIKKLAEADKRVAYVSLSRNFGKEAGMLAGFDHVTGDATVVIDADLQDPPELIPQMIKYWQEGYDDVYARRVNRHGETWLKKQTSAAFYRLLQQTTHIPIQQDTGDFRLLSRRCIEALKQLRENQRYTKGMFSWIGYKKKEISYSRDARVAGQTKWNYARLFDLAVEGIVSFTTAPLRWSAFLGASISLLAFFYLLILVVRTLLFGNPVAGYPSLMAVILFLGGVQLLSLGLIGEYVGRIFNETKRRPPYFVDEYHSGNNDTKQS
jgi:glycosyltransferase involved in cell wall biosynthesis